MNRPPLNRPPLNRPPLLLALLVLIGLALAACGSSSSDDKAKGDAKDVASEVSDQTSTTDDANESADQGSNGTDETDGSAEPGHLNILVTNDDGYSSDGIDIIAGTLSILPNVDVYVVAPLENQSGTSDSMSEGELTVTDVTTKSGLPAKAVAGTPADSVKWALDGGIDVRPDLVVSGINAGQNLGPFVALSGTVGAARTAVRAGIPAVAGSQGLAADASYSIGATEMTHWVETNRDAILDGTIDLKVYNLNFPSCGSDSVRGVVEVPFAVDLAGRDIVSTNCASELTDPVDDIDAFVNGFIPLSKLDPEEVEALEP